MNKKNKTEESNMPERKFGHGTLTVAVFINTVEKDGKEIKIRNIQLQKSFKNNDGEWEQRKVSLNPGELLKTSMYLQLCAQYIEENPIEQEGEKSIEIIDE